MSAARSKRRLSTSGGVKARLICQQLSVVVTEALLEMASSRIWHIMHAYKYVTSLNEQRWYDIFLQIADQLLRNMLRLPFSAGQVQY